MLVFFELCETKIDFCSDAEPDQNKMEFIPDGELEVAEETEIVAEEHVALDGGFSGHPFDPECVYELHHDFPFGDDPAARRSLDVETEDFNFDAIFSELPDCCESTISASHKSTECNSLDLPDRASAEDLFASEENVFGDVVFPPAESRLDGRMGIDDVEHLKAFGQQESEDLVDEMTCSQRERYDVPAAEAGRCRKSARIASRSGQKSKSSSYGDDLEIQDFIGSRKYLKNRDADEEFMPRREFSRHHAKKNKRSHSLSSGSRRKSPDSMKAMRQEKNRLAARKCRLKQKHQTETLELEVQEEENKKSELNEEIKSLQDELLQLQCIVEHHDSMVCQFDCACPFGPVGSDVSAT